MHEARDGDLLRANSTAEHVVALEHEHALSAAGEQRGAGQRVEAAADDDGFEAHRLYLIKLRAWMRAGTSGSDTVLLTRGAASRVITIARTEIGSPPDERKQSDGFGGSPPYVPSGGDRRLRRRCRSHCRRRRDDPRTRHHARPDTPGKVLMLGRSGLDGVTRADGVVRIGAATPVAALEGGDEPLAAAAASVADPEIRAQATVGGNLCAPQGQGAPRGDLQAPFLALDARVRSVGPDGETSSPSRTSSAAIAQGGSSSRSQYDDATAVRRTRRYGRPHSHHYSILTVCCDPRRRRRSGRRWGRGADGGECEAVERALAAGDPAAVAAQRCWRTSQPWDDALASVWYRGRVLPTVVARALDNIGKGA